MADDMKELDPKLVIDEVERTVNEHKNRPHFPEKPKPPEPYSKTLIPKEYEQTAVEHARSIFDKAKVDYIQGLLKSEQSVPVSTADREKQHVIDELSVSSKATEREALLRPSQLYKWANQFEPSIQQFRLPIAQAVDQDLMTPSSYAKFSDKLEQRIDKLVRITQEQRRDPRTRQISDGPMLTPLSKDVTIEQNGVTRVLHREVTLKLEDNRYIYEASETVDGKVSFISRWVTDAVNIRSYHIRPRFTLSVDGDTPQIQNDPRFAAATAEAFIKTFDFVTIDQNHWKQRAKRLLRWEKNT